MSRIFVAADGLGDLSLRNSTVDTLTALMDHFTPDQIALKLHDDLLREGHSVQVAGWVRSRIPTSKKFAVFLDVKLHAETEAMKRIITFYIHAFQDFRECLINLHIGTGGEFESAVRSLGGRLPDNVTLLGLSEMSWVTDDDCLRSRGRTVKEVVLGPGGHAERAARCGTGLIVPGHVLKKAAIPVRLHIRMPAVIATGVRIERWVDTRHSEPVRPSDLKGKGVDVVIGGPIFRESPNGPHRSIPDAIKTCEQILADLNS